MIDLKARQDGFTIVELVVVIVVIAILASIVLISYIWARQDAYNTRITSIASQYIKALDAYKIKNGQYPVSFDGPDSICLGSYPSTATFTENVCVYTAFPEAGYVQEINDAFATVGISQTKFEDGIIAADFWARGVEYSIPGYNNTSPKIKWYLKGHTDCGLGATAFYHDNPNTTACTYTAN